MQVKKREEVLVEGPSCRVTGSGSLRAGRVPKESKLWPPRCRGAELLLWAPIRFRGNLVLAGQLNVKAAGDGGRVNAPCVSVEGNFALRPEARLSIEGCENEAGEEDDEEDVEEDNEEDVEEDDDEDVEEDHEEDVEEDDEGDAAEGGCLHIGGDAELLGGQLLLAELHCKEGARRRHLRRRPDRHLLLGHRKTPSSNACA